MTAVADGYAPRGRLPHRDYLMASRPFRNYTMTSKGESWNVDYPSLTGIYALGPTAFRRYFVSGKDDPWIVLHPEYEVHPIREMIPYLTMLAGAATSAAVIVGRSLEL